MSKYLSVIFGLLAVVSVAAPTANEDYVDRKDGETYTNAVSAAKAYADSVVSNKQELLVSGSNIKTVNGSSILGSGNITIQGGSGDSSSDIPDAITNHVTSGYLCTVSAAQAMTNALPSWTKSANKPTYTASEIGALSTTTTRGQYIFSLDWRDVESEGRCLSFDEISDDKFIIDNIFFISPSSGGEFYFNGSMIYVNGSQIVDYFRNVYGETFTVSGSYGWEGFKIYDGTNLKDYLTENFTDKTATETALANLSTTSATHTASIAANAAAIATKIDGACATNISENVVGEHLYYSSTNLADNVELRLFSGEWVNAEYDGVGTADVIIDLTGVANDKVTDTLMVLNCAATGTLTVATSANACRVVHKKDANPLELKAGLNLLTFSRYRMANGTNEVLVTNNELE